MRELSRRTFIAGATGAGLAGLAGSLVSAPRAEAHPPTVPLAGQWPRMGLDTRNTCYQPMPGKIRRPGIAARTYLGGTSSPVMAARLDDDGTLGLLYISGGVLFARDHQLAELWSVAGLAPTDILGVYDLAGDGKRQVVMLGPTTLYALSATDGSVVWKKDMGASSYVYATATQIGHLDPALAGLQIVTWPYFSEYGYAFAFDKGVAAGYQLWQSNPAYANPAYLPEVVIGDADGDGATEVVIAGFREVTAFAGATGERRTGGAWNGHVDWETGPNVDGRNYGLIQLVDIDGDGRLEVVDLADGVTLHAAVVENNASGFSVLWDKFIEYTENHKALRSTVNSVRDVDGDGRVEIVCGLYNDTGDKRWHVLVADAIGGLDSPKLDLADRYLRGVQDFDGDGHAELLVSVEHTQTPGASATVELYAVGADGKYQLAWSLPSASVVTDPRSPYPSTIGPAGRNGRLEVLRADPLCSFVVLTGGSLVGYTYAGGKVTQAWTRADDGGVLHRIEDLDGSGSATVVYQSADGYLRLEKPDGTLIAQTQLAGLSGMATVARLDRKDHNSICVPGFGRVRVYDYGHHKLTERWQLPGRGEYVYRQGLEAVPAADLNGDGRWSLVFVDAVDDHTRMRVVDGDRRLVWEHVFTDLPAPTFSGPNGAYLWTFGDFSGHDGLDVYVGANRAGYNTEVSRILNGRNGALLASRDDGPGHVGAEFGPWTGAPAVHDIDGDGIDNVIFMAADVTYDLNGVNTSGVKILQGHIGTGWDSLGLYHTPIIADVDNDGLPEVLMTAGFNNLYVIDLDATGAPTILLWQVETNPGEIFGRRSALADVDGDGVLEVATLSDSGVLTCHNAATGAVKWSFTVPGGSVAPNVVAVDVDGDNHIEYVIGTADGTVYAIDARPNPRRRVKWSLSIGQRLGDIIAADVDGDRRSELVVTAEDGYLYVIDETH
ncbi:PQQ-binding-like beta-propeller repeat protein [Dactylosporangium sp. CA-233914]|uniref:outer membrane protein assembly factor BamB family protein n=1 Tax=Dactylosporangium sp. CA-233914 TaxID=3239934 RepID=UPI003D943D6F